jgi:phosphoribosylaminoimidazole carboxylase (NCAIR synthetase)
MVVVALEFWLKAQLAWGCRLGIAEQVHHSRNWTQSACGQKSHWEAILRSLSTMESTATTRRAATTTAAKILSAHLKTEQVWLRPSLCGSAGGMRSHVK